MNANPQPIPATPDHPPVEPSNAATLTLQPRRHRPIATWTFIVVNVVVWLLMAALGSSTNPDILVLFGAKDNELIVQGQLWRLVTPIFLHIDIVHLAFNTYAVYVFGSQIERFFGTTRFAGIYLLSGIVGVLASFSFSPHRSAGASGAIFGLIGTEAAFFYRYRNAFGRRGQQRLYNILIVIGYNLAFTFVASNIDVWGHLGGLVAGVLISWWLMPRYAVVLTEQGPNLVDANRPRKWAAALAIAATSIGVCSLLAVSLRAAQY
jgi:membrane associated rhomboid family serine protease